MDKNDVVKKILESKKYENLDSDIVEKVVSISEKKYKLKEVENYSKKKLHQIWGSYYSAYPNWDKLLKKYNQGQLSIEDLLKILGGHCDASFCFHLNPVCCIKNFKS